jgi:hypothetical protein
MYAYFEFTDNSYTKYLNPYSVKFSDDAGVYLYIKN